MRSDTLLGHHSPRPPAYYHCDPKILKVIFFQLLFSFTHKQDSSYPTFQVQAFCKCSESFWLAGSVTQQKKKSKRNLSENVTWVYIQFGLNVYSKKCVMDFPFLELLLIQASFSCTHICSFSQLHRNAILLSLLK